jgi:hypothetical protein
MTQDGTTGAVSLRLRWLVVTALLAPFLIAVPQAVLIPTWYEVSLHVADVLMLLHLVAVVGTIGWLVRRRAWRWPARIAASLGLLLVLVGAAFTTFAASTREGIFVCGRELDVTVDCPGGGQAFEFTSVCIAGNPKVEVEVRPGALPFMYPVPEHSAAAACAGLR